MSDQNIESLQFKNIYDFLLNDTLIYESIKEQIEDNFSISGLIPTNYMTKFYSRYNYLINKFNAENDMDKVKLLTDITDTFCETILNEINKKLNQKMPYYGNFFVQNIYEYFILDYMRFLKNFLINYIIMNKTDLVNSLNNVNTSSINVKSAKKLLKNKNDALIVSNLEEIIDTIISQDLDASTILDYATKDSNLEVYPDIFIRNYFVSKTINDNIDIIELNDEEFKNSLFKIIKDKQESFMVLLTELNSYFIAKFPKKDE